MTLLISLVVVLFDTFLGTILCFIKRSHFSILKVKILKIIASVYIEVIRGIPSLLQIMIVYNGSAILFGIDIEALPESIIVISLNSEAYVAELIRVGIDAVDKGQLEASRSLGMTESISMRLIVNSQAIRNILPAIGNEFVAAIKESSMTSTGVAELMYGAKVVSGDTYRSFEPLIIAGVFYFIMTFTLGRIMSYLERRLKANDIH